MTAPITTKTWTVLPNKRNAYVSLVDMTSWCLYENKVAMVTAGWTVKFSCDGVTGPSGAGDTTDRWLARANAGVRGTNTTTAQSYVVLQNADGVQVLLTFQGATDNISRVAFSPKGLYTLAGTPTFQPTASDEVTAGSIDVSSATSADRVMTIWVSNDTKNWSMVLFRAGALINTLGVERMVNFCGSGVFGDGAVDIPYVGYRYTFLARTSNSSNPGTISPTSQLIFGVTGAIARVFTGGTSKTIRVGAGEVMLCYEGNPGGGPSFPYLGTVNVFELNNASPVMPIWWSSFITAGATGILGYPIDWFQMVTSSATVPAQGDFVPGYEVGDTPGVTGVRSNWFVVLGAAMIRPWKSAAPSLETT